MLRSSLQLLESFQKIIKKSEEECGDDLKKIHQLIFLCCFDFFKCTEEMYSPKNKDFWRKSTNSLVYICELELVRLSAHILFLSYNGLYRNAFNNIRYVLESIIQSLYIDYKHPDSSLETKIEILSEIEDKREYRAIRLMDSLNFGKYKNSLQKEYRNLSGIIHPSHRQIITTLEDVFGGKQSKAIPTRIDCKEISKIHDSIKIMYDIFLFLYITYFPELKACIKKNPDFMKKIKTYELYLLSEIIDS